jgi:hypothetical protein
LIGVERPVSKELIVFYRHEQMERLKKLFSGGLKSGR